MIKWGKKELKERNWLVSKKSTSEKVLVKSTSEILQIFPSTTLTFKIFTSNLFLSIFMTLMEEKIKEVVS